MSTVPKLRVDNRTVYDLAVEVLVEGAVGCAPDVITLVIQASSGVQEIGMTDEQRAEKIARLYEKLAAARDLVRDLENELRELGEEPVS